MQGLSQVTDLPLVRGVHLGTVSLYPKFPEREKQQIRKKFGLRKILKLCGRVDVLAMEVASL